MKRISLLLLILLLITAPAFASFPRWQTNRLNPALICTVTVDGYIYGDCGNDGAGRGFLNIALWRGNGECDNPTLGGQAWHPEATNILSIQRTGHSLHARVMAPNYIPTGQPSPYCGTDESPGIATGVGGDIIEFDIQFTNSGVYPVNWTVTPSVDAACMFVEVTTYSAGTLDTPLIWQGDHFDVTGYSMVEDWRQGISTGAPVAYVSSSFPTAGVALSGPGTHHYDIFHFAVNLAKLSAVYQFCDVVAGQPYSGQTTFYLGNLEVLTHDLNTNQ